MQVQQASAPSLRRVSPFAIEKDYCNLREGEADRSHVESIKATLLANGTVPYPQVREKDGHIYCFDGFHRVTALRELGSPYVDVLVYPYTDLQAQEASFRGNLGRPWTYAETARFMLNQYASGKSTRELSTQYSHSENKIREFVKLAHWLSPSILQRIDNGISVSVGDILVDYEPDLQERILMAFVGMNVTRDNVSNLIARHQLRGTSRNIKSIPRNQQPVKQVLTPTPVHDPFPGFMFSLQGQIQSYVDTHGLSNDLRQLVPFLQQFVDHLFTKN